MELKLTYLKKAKKFIDKNNITIEEIDELVIKAVKKKVFNIDENIDIKDLKGVLKGKTRIRKGKIRIIIEINNNEIIIEAIIENIDFRGDIYK